MAKRAIVLVGALYHIVIECSTRFPSRRRVATAALRRQLQVQCIVGFVVTGHTIRFVCPGDHRVVKRAAICPTSRRVAAFAICRQLQVQLIVGFVVAVHTIGKCGLRQ